jgi:hypothetical protein
MSRLSYRHFFLPLLLISVIAVACEEDAPTATDREGNAREETREVLQDLRTELDQGIDPERKENLVERCTNALDRLRAADDPQADRVANFCDSLEDTNPNTPAAWDDIRNRLNELITQLG